MNHAQKTKASGKWDKEHSKLQPEVLPVTKLRFTGNQLNTLNYIFTKKLTQNASNNENDMAKKTGTIVERLIQRLICAVGSYDSRFATTFLITLHDSNTNKNSNILEYIVRLDALSTPSIFQNDEKPNFELVECNTEGNFAGYAKIRLRNKTSTKWSEFINSSGYLRRDKVQERFVELLATAAASSTLNTVLEVDESSCCGVPGKIVDAATLTHLLRIPAEERIFYGPAANNLRFPDPRDFRLAIVDEPSGVRLRIGFLSPSFAGKDLEVKLLLGIAIDSWPQTTDFPTRIPLGHTDCLLYHQAAEMGMFLISNGAQTTNWQIRFPAAEVALLNNFKINSPVALILNALYMVLEEVHSNVSEEKCKFPQKLLNKQAVRETFWRFLENDNTNPLSTLSNWTSANISKYVLLILDTITGYLRQLFLPSYFFPNCNLLSQPSYIYEEDYLIDANRVHMYIARLYDESIRPILEDDDYRRMKSFEVMEATLICKWSDFIESMLPPKATRSNRFSFSSMSSNNDSSYTNYTSRQIEYIGLLLKSMLNVKQYAMQFPGNVQDELDFINPESATEDIIYLLVTIIDQAKQQFSTTTQPNKSKYSTKTRNRIDAATAKLVELIRKDKQLRHLELTDDTILVKTVLKWLYKGLDQSKTCLGSILRPYLNRLFQTSHENSWHLEVMRKCEVLDEMKSVGVFSRLVNENKITPAAGLVESVNKGWSWARDMLELVQRSHVRVVFTPERGKCNRHILSLPSYENKPTFGDCYNETNIKSANYNKIISTLKDRKDLGYKNSTLPARNCFTFLRNEDTILYKYERENMLTHEELRYCSPLTEVLKNLHRFGSHRCPGDLLSSLVLLQKISILQEVSCFLPPSERQEMLNTIQKLSKESKRQIIKRRYTLPPLRNVSKSLANSNRKSSYPQIYKPTSEDANLHETDLAVATARDDMSKGKLKDKDKYLKKLNKGRSCQNLIESCRAARLKEDSKIIFHENVKIKSLFKFDDVN